MFKLSSSFSNDLVRCVNIFLKHASVFAGNTKNTTGRKYPFLYIDDMSVKSSMVFSSLAISLTIILLGFSVGCSIARFTHFRRTKSLSMILSSTPQWVWVNAPLRMDSVPKSVLQRALHDATLHLHITQDFNNYSFLPPLGSVKGILHYVSCTFGLDYGLPHGT